MRWLLGMWFMPLALFWGWLGLAQMNAFPNSIIFSRLLYDEVFRVYTHLTGFSEEQIISAAMKACILDSIIVFAFFAFVRRKKIKAWWLARKDVSEARAVLAENPQMGQPVQQSL